jgi:hypothetical protein
MVPLLLWLAMQTSPQTGTTGVVCAGTGAATGREFVLERAGEAAWRLRYRDRHHPRWITLSLPGARPGIEGATARLQFRNANGGRQVELDVSPAGSRLDVYVDYGLDVNIDPDLSPDVDLMNTEGPLTTVDCRVTHGPVKPQSR